jgi:hypothetical protein
MIRVISGSREMIRPIFPGTDTLRFRLSTTVVGAGT